MSNLQNTTRLFAILALVLILAGCTTPTVVAPPTPDLPKIRTEAASTVVAKLTIEAALNPTFTPTEPPAVITPTPEPSATEPPAPAQATATPVPTFTPIPTLKPSTGGGAVYPTATRRAGPDQAQFITQSPSDGKAFNPGEVFDASWTFKNVGTSTWNTNYRIRAATGKGTVMSNDTIYYLSKAVKPGETITVYADMVAPSSAGRYVSYWELNNDNNATFYAFYLVIDVK